MTIISENDKAVLARLFNEVGKIMRDIEARGSSIRDLDSYRQLMDVALPFQKPDGVEYADVARWIPDLVIREGLTAAVAVPHGEGPFPVLLHVHGHGLRAGHAVDFEPWIREIASHGFVVLFPDYSLQDEVTYEDQIEEMQFAAEWVRDNAGLIDGDGGKMVIGGDSAGGILAFDLLLRNLARQDGVRFKAFEGVDADIHGLIAARPNPVSLLAQVTPETPLPPVILVIGSADFMFSRHLDAARHLNANGKHFEWHVYHGLPHDFAKLPELDAMHVANRRMMEFLHRAVVEEAVG